MEIYPVLVLFTVFILVITVADVLNSRLLYRKNKAEIIFICILIFCASICEYFGEVTKGIPSLSIVVKITHLIEFCIAPCIGVATANAYGTPSKAHIPEIVAGIHILFECIALPMEWVFRVDENHIYHREKLYFVYILFFLLSIFYCYSRILWNNRKYQARLDAVSLLIVAFLAFGIVMQFIVKDANVDFLCVALVNYFLYHYRETVVNQVDITTRLLNRRCYETCLANVKSPCYILIFDINKFKLINDAYGHAVGDKCLAQIAQKIFDVYGKYGFCFRIGGDEFCVLLRKDLDKLKQLNKKFAQTVDALSVDGHPLYGVSVGSAHYDKDSMTIDDAVRQADEQMYRSKALQTD